MKKRPTIVDIAKAVGVTDGTVSRALANDPRVRAETRMKILEAAKRLKYRPHLSARLFKQGLTKNIGVYSDTGSWIFYNYYFGRLLSGLADAAREEGERLIFYLPDASREKPAWGPMAQLSGLNELMDGRVDGAVVLRGDRIGPEQREILSEASIPVVFLANNIEIPGFFQMVSGAYERMRGAAEYLYSMGHRKIGYSGFYQDSHYVQASLKALRDFYELHQLAFDHRYVETPTVFRYLSVEDLRERTHRLRQAGVTAIISSEINEALIILEILKNEGVDLPRDMSLISFGPLPEGSVYSRPLLTLFEANLKGCGQKCFGLLKEAREGKPARTESMQWDLTTGGQTVGMPRST